MRFARLIRPFLRFATASVLALSASLTIAPLVAQATPPDNTLTLSAPHGDIGGLKNFYSVQMDATTNQYGTPQSPATIYDTTTSAVLCTTGSFTDAGSDGATGELYTASCESNGTEVAGDAVDAEYSYQQQTHDYTATISNQVAVTPTPLIATMDLSFQIPATGGSLSLPVHAPNATVSVVCGATGVYNASGFTCTYPATGSVLSDTASILVANTTGAVFGNGHSAWPGEDYLLAVTSWGGNWTSFNGGLANAPLLVSVPLTLPETVTTLTKMFMNDPIFDEQLTNWDTTNVTSMAGMFDNATRFNNQESSFASLAGGWNTSNVTNMANMFQSDVYFNQDVSTWNTANVTDMSYMFASDAAFNNGGAALTTTVGGWNTTNVNNMSSMFQDAYAFAQDPGTWDTSHVTDMSSMFNNAYSFDGDLSQWNFASVMTMSNMLVSSGFSEISYTQLLIALATQASTSGFSGPVTLDASAMYGSSAAGARAYLINQNGWTITDGGLDNVTLIGTPAMMTLDFAVPSAGETVTLPLRGDLATGQITCGAAGSYDAQSYSCTYPATPFGLTSEVTISIGTNAGVQFGTGSAWAGSDTLTAVPMWSGDWTDFTGAFYGASSLVSVPGNLPSTVTNLTELFDGASQFNQDIITWNTSNVTNMALMFQDATSFNNGGFSLQTFPGGWNTGNVTNMWGMFSGDTSFNQDVSSWDTSKVTYMPLMFKGDEAFNNGGMPLNTTPGGWNTTSVGSMSYMFAGDNNFDQDVSSWDTHNVVFMDHMFDDATSFNNAGVALNTTPSGWNTSRVGTMAYMFNNAVSFNQDVSTWDTSSVTDMTNMFSNTLDFNNHGIPLATTANGWVTTNVVSMASMFSGATAFNQDVRTWDTRNVTDMDNMFTFAVDFNNHGIPLATTANGWNTSHVANMDSMFFNASTFNQNISSWDTHSVTDMGGMFDAAIAFDNHGAPLATTAHGWNTSHVQTMSNMFAEDFAFNQNVSSWDTSSVTDMSSMFAYVIHFNNGGAPLATTLNGWNTHSVTDMNSMFYEDSSFNQDISSWDTSSVQNMAYMFSYDTSFNNGGTPLVTTLNGWNTSSVTNMNSMFYADNFDQDVSTWSFADVIDMSHMFETDSLSATNYGALLLALAAALQSSQLQPNVTLGVSTQYLATTGISAAHAALLNDGWTLNDNGPLAVFTVPNLVGLTTSAALTALTNAGLTATPVETAITSGATSTNDGDVISQTVAAGTIETSATTQVDFSYYHFVAPAPAPAPAAQVATYFVPNLVGLTATAAQAALNAAGFSSTVSLVPVTSGATSLNDGLIANQSVAPGSLETNPQLALTLGYYNALAKVLTVPNLVGLSATAAQAALNAAGFTSTVSLVPVTSGATSTNDGMIATQSVAPGSLETNPQLALTLSVFRYVAAKKVVHVFATCSFATGSTTTSSGCVATLKRLAKAIASGHVTKVVVVGFSDSHPKSGSSARISVLRARAVEKSLVTQLRKLHATLPKFSVSGRNAELGQASKVVISS